jgi:hypothetical protein
LLRVLLVLEEKVIGLNCNVLFGPVLVLVSSNEKSSSGRLQKLLLKLIKSCNKLSSINNKLAIMNKNIFLAVLLGCLSLSVVVKASGDFDEISVKVFNKIDKDGDKSLSSEELANGVKQFVSLSFSKGGVRPQYFF